MKKFVLDPKTLPIRFELGGKTYCGMPDGCVTERNGTNITYTSVIGDVEVKAKCVVYDDFDASEWTVYFTNKGSEKSPALRYVYVINTVFEGENNKIYTCNGDIGSADGYVTDETSLSDGEEIRQIPDGGRSCDQAFPYQRILFDGYGHNIAIGWPGKWESLFKKVNGGIQYWAAQQESPECFCIAMLPGETIRTPLIVVVSFEGDLERGINVWRRWYLKYVKTAKPYLAGSYHPPGTVEFTHASEENQIEHIRKAKEHGIDINLWWLDAGWYNSIDYYGNDDWWSTLGEWVPDAERFPNGLASVGIECEKNGMDFLLWFEAERVTWKATVYNERPDWILSESYAVMLDISQDECCDYLIKKVGDALEESHAKVYRQDCNFAPYPMWTKKDTDDRRGATENHHIQNLLRFWDALKERFPYLLIDACAQGGRRNDIESMRRAVPMHHTDFCNAEPPVLHSFMQTLYTWIPYFRGFGGWEEYSILSSFAPMMQFSYILYGDRTEEEYAQAREYAALFYKVAPVLGTADFYALTPYHKSSFKWTAWQFDEPEKEHGIFEVIRNNAAPDESLTVSPRPRDGKYLFRNMRTGEEFIHEGGQITFTQPVRSVTFWEYSKI